MFEPRSDETVKLADGRMLAYCEWGNPEGVPVVFLHGSPLSRLWRPDVAVTNAAGCRLITLDRAGYGHSDPPSELSLRVWTDDVAEFADLLRLERFAIVGFSAGDKFAAACAAVFSRSSAQHG